jgi:hypothetical protein
MLGYEPIRSLLTDFRVFLYFVVATTSIGLIVPLSSSVSISVHLWFNLWLRLRYAESIRGFFTPNRTVVPKPTAEANRCNLRHVPPKTLQKALYVGSSKAVNPNR